MTTKSRDEKITHAVTTEGFEYKGVFYKTLSTRILMLLEKFKSPYYYGGDQLKGLMDYLYIASHDPKQVQRISFEEFDDIIFEFSDSLTAEDLANLGKIVQGISDESSSTVIEVKEDRNSKKP